MHGGYYGQPYRAARCFLGYAALNLRRIDGELLRNTGKGIEEYSARQVCNIVFSIIQDNFRNECGHLDESTDEYDLMLEKVGLKEDMEAKAAEGLAAWQQMQGIDTENVEISPQMQAMMDNAWMYSEDDVEMKSEYMGQRAGR